MQACSRFAYKTFTMPARLLALLSLGLAAMVATGSEAPPDVEIRPPILVTSAGQSADPSVLGALLRRLGMEAEVEALAQQDQLAGVNTVLMALGGSQKALGAAGISVDEEMERIDALFAAAEAAELTVIGLHIGGEARRGALSERFIEAAAPRVDFLIVTEDGNQDGYFTTLAEEIGIGIIVAESVSAVGAELRNMFAAAE